MRHILEQDDCTLDSYNYFAEKFQKLIGESVVEFKKWNVPKETEEGMCMIWEDDKFMLEYCGDYPFHVLYDKKAG